MRKVSLLLVTLVLGLLFVSNIPTTESQIAAKPQTETDRFLCFADTFVDSSNPDNNYGGADFLSVGYYEYYIWYDITYLAFEVTGLPSDATVTEVKLEISVKEMPIDGHTVHIGIWQCDSFGEYTTTWNNKPSMDTTDTTFVNSGYITSDTRWEFTLKDVADDTYEAHTVRGNGYYYFFLYTDTDSFDYIFFDTRDDLWNPPMLAVTYAEPEPELTSTTEEEPTSETITSDENSIGPSTSDVDNKSRTSSSESIPGFLIISVFGLGIYFRRRKSR